MGGGVPRRHVLAGAAGLAALAAGRAGGQPAARILTAAPATAPLRAADAAPAPVLAFEGMVPGPILRARQGEPFRLRFVNRLDQPTALHWHGLRIDNRMDGVPGLTQEAVEPGGAFDIAFTPRDAGTFLYRPWHPEHGGRQQARGLAGLLIVDGPAPPAADREVVLILADFAFDPAGGLAEEGAGPASRTIAVNGTPSLAIAARAHERLWLRIANAAPARLMQLDLPGQVLTLMALDGQPCEPFRLAEGRIALGPGQRAEIALDVTGAPGTAAPIAVDNLFGTVLSGALAVEAGPPARSRPLDPPAPLPKNPIAEAMDFQRAFRIDLPIAPGPGGTTFSRRADLAPGPQPAFQVRRGTVVMAALANQTDVFQAVHLHGHQARLLDGLDDGWKPFFLDTVPLAPRSLERIAFLADNPGRWALTAQAVNGPPRPLVAWFEVT